MEFLLPYLRKPRIFFDKERIRRSRSCLTSLTVKYKVTREIYMLHKCKCIAKKKAFLMG